MRLGVVTVLCAVWVSACSTAPGSVESLTRDRLVAFSSEDAFDAYRADVQAAYEIARGTGYDSSWAANWTANGVDLVEDSELVVVTGSRVEISTPDNPSITNTQEAGVDEGDVVKQIGQYLIVLQDGRLFSIDLEPDGEPGLAYVDRMNVYRSPDESTWYDEMLVRGDRIIVTGYSYDWDASTLTAFRLTEDGRFERDRTFAIPSDDYYDTDNYATRIVGDRFIIHTPMDLASIEADEPAPWLTVVALPEPGEVAVDHEVDSLSDWVGPVAWPGEVYQPVQPTLRPMLHTVTICEMGEDDLALDEACQQVAFIAPQRYVYYASDEHIYLWVSHSRRDWDLLAKADEDGRCERTDRAPVFAAHRAMVYRISIEDGALDVLPVRGLPFDQFSLDASDDSFRALVEWNWEDCASSARRDHSPPAQQIHMSLIEAPLDAFGARAQGDVFDVHPVPALLFGSYETIENRFTETHVVYGAGGVDWEALYHAYRDDYDWLSAPGLVVAELAAPQFAEFVASPHSILRLERLGEDVIATGYRPNGDGLHVSFVPIGDEWTDFRDTIVLDGRYESENRSHAFNATPQDDGGWLIGVPTVQAAQDALRWYWRSDASDLSFLDVREDGQLSDLGALLADDDSVDDSYRCEVSCVDWYGNSRPIFTGGRILALSGTELIEGRPGDEGMVEHARLNLTAPPPR